MLLPCLTTPTNSHPLWHMKVLDTKILYWTKWRIGTPMALPLGHKLRSTCRVGPIQDLGIHGTTWDPPTKAGQDIAKLRKDIEEYHSAYGIDWDETDIDTFIARRPDGLAFDKEKKLCVFLEYTRAMDTNEDWAEKKEQEKNDRYSSHLGFINHRSNREKSAAGKPPKPTSQREFEAPFILTSSLQDWSHSG